MAHPAANLNPAPDDQAGGCRLLDELPLPALSEIVTRLGPRPDSLLRCCRSTWRLHGDLTTWHRWMMRTYGPADALHKMRHSRWLDRDSEEKVLAAATLLLAAGAHVNIPEERVGYWTPSILHWAVSKNYTHVVDLLHAQAVVDENVVCAAAAQGNVAVLAQLVSTVSEQDFSNWRDFAFLHAASGGEVETAAWLLDRGANIHINDGQALFEGAYHGHLGVVQLLVDRGIDVRCRNDGALLAAAFKGHMAVAQLLLLKGCRVDSQRGRALVQAASCGHVEMCRLLLRYRPSPGALREALDAASRKGDDAVASLLLQHGAEPHADGATLLHAAMHNHAAVVRLLIRAGANVKAVIDASVVESMIRDGSFEALAAIQEEGLARGEDLGPSAWGLSLTTFVDREVVMAERTRLILLMRTTVALTVLSARDKSTLLPAQGD